MRTFSVPSTHWHPDLDYNAFCQCANEYSGNFYDFIPQDGGGLAISFGDLPSAGEVQAFHLHCLEALVRGLGAGSGDDIAGLARELNSTLNLLGPRDICAPWFYARIDPARRHLQYVNAGHEPALLVRGDRAHRLDRTGAALGLSTRGVHRQKTIGIEEGDVLALFSETVPEETVLRVVLEHRNCGTAELTQTVLESCGRGIEDRSFAAIRVVGAGRHLLLEDHAEMALCAA
ncbi:MAG TPA: PP2C family protein-serine/threonine phosphatase [Bryobacteraceae bacterium]|nr:PP2C family protein-serine/threonine phosphatase [Bryobacteraceae bacterium]